MASVAGVAGVAPYVELQALAVRTPEMLPVLLRGIDPQAESSVTDVAPPITQGQAHRPRRPAPIGSSSAR